MSEKLLLVDDDPTFQKVTKSFLLEEGYQVDICSSAEEAEDQIKARHYDLLLTDLNMGGKDGLEFIGFVKKWSPETPVLMITGFASVETAVAAMQAGAEDYLTKPCRNDELVLKIRRVIEKNKNWIELNRLRQEVSERSTFSNIIGKSPAMQKLFQLILQVAETDASVLIQGETGTGKELVARAIHFNSLRKDKPFISVNCAALAENLLESELFGHEKGAFTGAIKQKSGRFEMANGGTLFLDEVADIPVSTQVKLLRVLQEREFERVGGAEIIKTDIRILSATNQNLLDAINTGSFREDLYYRLNVMPIILPPLRDRSEDITILVESFVAKYSNKFGKRINGITPTTAAMLLNANWPGNVRELENVIERAVILCPNDKIDINHLLMHQGSSETQIINDAINEQMTEQELTKVYAKFVLNKFNGNKKKTSEVLGINFRTLQSRLEEA